MSADFWILLTAILASSACAMVGVWLVVRQQAMLGDAISHAVLPGLVLAFLLSGSRSVIPMLLGAIAAGIVTVFLTDLLSRTGRLYRDAALGIVFTFLFAVGVILVTLYTGMVDLDQECVLYGEIAYVPWDLFTVGGKSIGPRAVWILGGALILNLLLVGLAYRRLLITSFDPRLSRTLGMHERLWHYLLMIFVAFTIVAAFEVVGAILIVALLIIPAATAVLLSSRMSSIFLIALGVGILSSVSGFYLAEAQDGSISGAIAVCAGVIFALVMLGTWLLTKLHRRRQRVSARESLTNSNADTLISDLPGQ